jgi:hypothetical protein
VVHAEDQAFLARLVDHRAALGRRVGHRLLHQHAAAHLERLDGEGRVRCRRCEHVHDLRSRRCETCKVGRDDTDAETRRERVGRIQVGIADADKFDEVEALQRREVVTGDVTGADNRDPQSGVVRSAHGVPR